jgi:hypothetical protein
MSRTSDKRRALLVLVTITPKCVISGNDGDGDGDVSDHISTVQLVKFIVVWMV